MKTFTCRIDILTRMNNQAITRKNTNVKYCKLEKTQYENLLVILKLSGLLGYNPQLTDCLLYTSNHVISDVNKMRFPTENVLLLKFRSQNIRLKIVENIIYNYYSKNLLNELHRFKLMCRPLGEPLSQQVKEHA